MGKGYLTMSAPEQSLKEAKELPTPLGERHLHYSHRDGEGRWVVRGKRGPLCGTPRCRRVFILEMGTRGDGINVEVMLTGAGKEKPHDSRSQ